MAEERLRSKELIGKVLISEETGKKFGVIGDIDYVTESGELINLALVESTAHTSNMNLQQDEKSRMLVPFSAVKSVGDFVIVSEKDEPFLRAAEVMAARLPRAERVTVPRAGHMVNIEEAELFNAAVLRFLGSLPPPEAA